MSDLMEKAVSAVNEQITAAYHRAAAKGELPGGASLTGSVEVPKDSANGDLAANHAMAGARALHMAPRRIAELLIANMELADSWFVSAEAAGPGFINFRLGSRWYGDVLAAIQAEGESYGSGTSLAGQRIMVEFVSANPTGPLHFGGARNAVFGDTVARVMTAAGYTVETKGFPKD